ncbi:hypothetical protein RIF29_06854 [Crotalaria pallida]|uniref:Cytochrome P450 n=1 Tax=Crotalaria pallida TaxID=3830 RepID=A0AAN9PAJ7_CROPI
MFCILPRSHPPFHQQLTMISTILFLILVFIFILSLIKHLTNQLEAEKRLPPGPRTLPFIGNLHKLIGDDLPHRSLHHLSAQHGPLMFLKLGSIPTLVVSSAEMAREIFKNYDIVFSGRPVLYAANRISYNGSGMSFAPYGDYWREIRKIVTLELLSAKRVQSFQAVRFEEVKFMIHSIASSLGPVNLSELTLSRASNIVCRVAFGLRNQGGADNNNNGSEFYEIFRETQELLGGFCIADFFPGLGRINKFNGLERRLEKNFRELDNFYDKVIKEHNNKEYGRLGGVAEHEDLVDVLLQVQRDPNQAIVLSDDRIKGILTDIFLAGTDTASATIIWTLSELIRNPEIMKRAKEEVREVAKNKEMVEESDLSSLVYLKLVVKEALRLHPPAPLLLPRETLETCTIKGYEIPAKTRVFVNAKSIAMDPSCWENPNEFLPERFLDSAIDFRGQHFEMLPFGAGRRGCPGVNFGMLLVELALANLLFHFDWTLPRGLKVEDMDMDEAFGITMHKKTPLWMKATPIIHV